MSTTCYKYCFVLSCSNNSKKNPDKYFFRVPYNKLLREQWCAAVDRAASTIKQASTAFCCSDHFDLEQDLDRFSASDNPKLEKGTIPSLQHKNNQERNEKAMEAQGLYKSGALTKIEIPTPENLYVREVVYIEENYNDQFLQENIETEDCLNVDGPESEVNNLTTEPVVEILDDQDVMEAAPPAKTSSRKKTKEIVKSVKTKSTEARINKNHINLHYTTHLSKDRREACKSNGFKQINGTSKILLPTVTIPKYQAPKQPKTVAVQPLPVRIAKMPETVNVLNAVNKWKYVNPDEFNQLLSQKKAKSSNAKSDDEDCILVEEQNVLSNNNASVDETESIRLITTLPSSISVKVSKCGIMAAAPVKMPQTSNNALVRFQPGNNALLQVPPSNNALSQVPPNSNALVRVQPINNALVRVSPSNNALVRFPPSNSATVRVSPSNSATVRVLPSNNPLVPPKARVREFSKINEKPQANQDKVIKLIHLMLSENQMLLACNKRNRVKIARTKKNEFKIFDNIYYYRTSEQFEKNYFFMNITRNSRHNNEIIQRNYGIYWGDPRVSCVGIVETKGALDEETKDFVFQQVKKSLFNENGQQNLKLSNLVQPVQLVREKSVSTTTKPIASPAKKASTILNLDGDDSQLKQANTMGQQYYNHKPSDSIVISAPRTINTISSNQFPPPPISKSLAAKAEASRKRTKKIALSNILPTRPTIRKLAPTVKATASPERPMIRKLAPSVKATASPERPMIRRLAPPLNAMASPERSTTNPLDEVPQDETRPNNELIRLSNYLTPATRKLINKLKYFELNNSDVFTVNIGPYCPAKKKPYNIVFTKNKPECNFQPVSKDLYVSKLVNYLFQAIYPFMNDGSNEPIRIPSPHSQDMSSDFTPAMSMESLILSETSKIDEAINSLQASVTKLPSPSSSRRKYQCSACPESFERTYQLKRHHFVQHTPDKAMGAVSTTSKGAFDDTPEKMSMPMDTWPSDFQLESVIKTEKPEADESDQSLLTPLFDLFEEAMKSPEDFPLVKCKEEPEEEYMEMEDMTAMPLLIDQHSVHSQPKARKRKACDDDTGEETDSAPERLEKKIESSTERKPKRNKILNIPTLAPKSKLLKMNRNGKRSRKIIPAWESQKTVSVVPVKISAAKTFMKTWPTLTVDLVDIGKSKK